MRWLPAIAAVVLIAGCGGDDKAPKPIRQSQAPTAPKVRAAPAPPRDVAVIRGWADTLRAGRVAAASRFFRPPAVVENGTGEMPLGSLKDARAFNASLPCGAVLLDARRVAGGYTIAVFRLTERPGGDCGPGTGQRAATAFRFSGRRITEWRRVALPQFEDSQPPRV